MGDMICAIPCKSEPICVEAFDHRGTWIRCALSDGHRSDLGGVWRGAEWGSEKIDGRDFAGGRGEGVSS